VVLGQVFRPYESEQHWQHDCRLNKPGHHNRGPDCEECAPDEPGPQNGKAYSEECGQGRVQDGRPHVSERALDPLLPPALALEEFVHDVRGLVHADAQTHDEEDERDDVELEAEVVDGGLDDDHDVDDARGHDQCA